jgi:hypothetical protein
MKKLLSKTKTFLIETEFRPYTVAIICFLWIVALYAFTEGM